MMILLWFLLPFPLGTCAGAAAQAAAVTVQSVVQLLHSALEQGRLDLQALDSQLSAHEQKCNGSLGEERRAIDATALAARSWNARALQAATRALRIAGEIAGHDADAAALKAQQDAAAGVRTAGGAGYMALRADSSKTTKTPERGIRALGARDDAGVAKAKAALKQQALEDKAKDEEALAETAAAQKERETHLGDITAACAQKAAALETRRKLRAGELAAIQEAADIVAGPGAAGTAMRGSQKRPVASRERTPALAASLGSLAEAEGLLEARSREFHSELLSAIAFRVKLDDISRYDHAPTKRAPESGWGGAPLLDFVGVALSGAPDLPDLPDYQRELYFRPVSVTAYCIIWLTIMEVLPHGALAMARHHSELCGHHTDAWYVTMLEELTKGTSMSGVMSLLFFASRQLVLALTEGLGDPSAFVKVSEVVATAGLTLHMIIVLILGIGRNKAVVEPHLQTGQIWPKIPRIVASDRSMVILQYCSVACMLGGVAVVLLSMVFLLVLHGFSASSASLQSAAVLFAAYYGVHVGVWASAHFGSAGDLHSTWGRAIATVERVPMQMVLLLTQRMRFLQYYPPDGTPPLYCRLPSGLLAVAVLVELAVDFVGVWTNDDELEEGVTEDVPPRKRWLTVSRHVAAGVGWASTLWLTVAFLVHANRADTPAMSQTVRMIIDLCFLFFTVHCAAWVVSALIDLLGIDLPLLQDTAATAMITVGMCPQISVLFLAARLRALQITRNSGAPQWWEQDCLGLCFGAVLVQTLCCIVLPIYTGMPPILGPDGNVLYEVQPLSGACIVTALRYTAFLGIYVGFLGVSLSIFTITPESATAGRFHDMESFHSMLRSALWLVGFVLVGLVMSSAKMVGLAVKFAVESLDDTYLGIQLVADRVTIDVFNGFVDIHGLVATNPPGFLSNHLLTSKTIRLKVNIGQLVWSRGDVFEITELVLEDVSLNYELAESGSNIQSVLRHLESKSPIKLSRTPSGRHSLRRPGTFEEARERLVGKAKIDLKRLRIHNVSVGMALQKYGAKTRAVLPDMDITDICFNEKVERSTVAFVASFVVKTILTSAASSSRVKDLLVNAKDKASKAIGLTSCLSCLPHAPPRSPRSPRYHEPSPRGGTGVV